MGMGRVNVKYKDGKPAPNHKVVITFDLIGLPTGTFEDYTDNNGEAVFAGIPALSAGRGKVIGPSGHFVEFTVGTNWNGDFDPISVITYWNPIQGGTDNITSNLKRLTDWFLGNALTFAIIAIGAFIVYMVVKNLPAVRIASGVKSILSKGKGLVSNYVK